MANRAPCARLRRTQGQRGFGLPGVLAALAIATMLAVLGSVELARRVNDAAAEATGRYLLAVRDALIAFQIRHEAWLSGVDVSAAPTGTYPPAPPLAWVAGTGGVQLAHGTVALLKDQGLLPASQPDHTPLGERAQFLILRQGACPGDACGLQSYVYTCHPVSARPSTKSHASCLDPAGPRAEYDAGLLGQVMLSSDGYGAHDAFAAERFVGPLVDADRAWFPLSAHRGHAVVAGTLAATPFGQFVRMGDTRHVRLADRLTVDGIIQTDTGLLFGASVDVGAPCSVPRMFAATGANELAVCGGGVWSVSGGKSVQGVFTNLVNGAYVAPPSCQPPAAPFRYVSLSSTDVTVTGAGLNVHGNVGGDVNGSGSVNATGSVSLSGTFSGGFQSAPSSSIRVAQAVALDAASRIAITPPGANARASVIQGCAH